MDEINSAEKNAGTQELRPERPRGWAASPALRRLRAGGRFPAIMQDGMADRNRSALPSPGRCADGSRGRSGFSAAHSRCAGRRPDGAACGGRPTRQADTSSRHAHSPSPCSGSRRGERRRSRMRFHDCAGYAEEAAATMHHLRSIRVRLRSGNLKLFRPIWASFAKSVRAGGPISRPRTAASGAAARQPGSE